MAAGPIEGSHVSGERLLELDGCRGIAALAVALAHFTFHYDLVFGYELMSPAAKEYPTTVLLASRVPVYFFFLISGFVITMSLRNVNSVWEFVAGRVSRLYPAYWAAVIATSTLLLAFPFLGDEPTGSRFVANLLMFQLLLGVRNIDPIYWSLAYEVVFYVLIGSFLAFFGSGRSRIKIFAASWLLTSAAVPHLIPAGANVLADATFAYAPFFIGGIGFFLWWDGDRSPATAVLILASLLIAGTRVPLHGMAVATTIWVAFFLVISGKATWLRAPPFQFLGRISYPIYLFHLAPGYLTIHTLDQLAVPAPICIASATVVVVASASAMHYLIESPARRSLRSLLLSYSSRLATPTQL